jgi:anti-anti-sigma factor
MINNDIIPKFDDEKDENLQINLQTVSEVEHCLVLALTGYIDTYNASFFQKRVQMAIEAGFIRLIFNCSSLNYVSSAGIGSFITVLKTVKSKDGNLVLLGVQPKVGEVFQLLGLSQFFNIRDTVDSAIDCFRGNPIKQNPGAFPKIFPCPVCPKKLKADKSGRFRCSVCKTIISIDNAGVVSLG